ncbi:DUF1990 family protein [Brevibacterium marinum]|uniref:Uncharacterized protein (UPF0548 family) n=1 Tax=Brevibacterium marinum TaxID=418643 RepID=A0A846RUC2_9MICO|nr:DUF1990 family protein [Brevibacterium marinum]NJC55075.1 uncharacterized protein (UPF0548 family) [Brevibacterium marinum]
MNQLEHTLDLGPVDLFPAAREAILTWKLQESAGVIARPVRRVRVGQIVGLWLNPVWPRPAVRLRGRDLALPIGSCEVVDVIDTAGTEAERAALEEFGAERTAGFVYRTLPEHLESGEQSFRVFVGTNDRLGVSITSQSVPGHPLLQAVAPMSVAAQKMMARRYANGLKQMLRQQGSPVQQQGSPVFGRSDRRL